MTVEKARRRRRPSGDPATMRPELRVSTCWWAFVLAGVAAALAWAHYVGGEPLWFEMDEAVVRWMESIRTAWLVDVADGVEWLGSIWSLRLGLWAGVAVLVVFRRWRQLLVFSGSVFTVGWMADTISDAIARPAPPGALGAIDGFTHPSLATAGLAVVIVGLVYALAPRGRLRRVGFGGAAALVAVAGLSRMYLSTAHTSDLVLGTLGGAAIAVGAFTVFVPDESFPIDYRRRKAAHLPVTGARGARLREALEQQLLLDEGSEATAMRHALRDHLGCDIVQCQLVDLAPFGEAGSAGSTPLRLSVTGRIRGDVFAKLYSMNHLRSDRWYKLGRAILYGRLEDERAFSSVRRLVEYEDYMLRVMRDAGLPSPEPLGVIRIVPGREYLIVTQFFDGSVEIGHAELDLGMVDEALGIVRRMWDAGVAHRDLKPANLLVHDGHVKLIDVAFGEIGPSPWRRYVDLANMMLILALRTGPELVHERALLQFTPEDVGEAFAAARGVTIPSQLRYQLQEHAAAEGDDLVEVFRHLAPDTAPVRIQRWGVRRFALLIGVLVGGLILAAVIIQNLRGVGLL